MTVFLNLPLKKNGLLCMLFYYRCKYVLDFYIVLFLSMLSQSSLCLIKFLIFCTNARLYSFFPLNTRLLSSHVQAKDTKLLRQPHATCLDGYLAAMEGRLTKLFIGGSGLILRPAQPPFRFHKPLEGRMPSQRLRPALPMIRLL